MRVILATRNPSKLQQIQTLFNGSGIELMTLDHAGIDGAAVENGTTLEENSTKKAEYAHERAPGQWVMAEDTGLFIHALHGEPGIYSARWIDGSTEEVAKYCLMRLYGEADRMAVFRTVVVMFSPQGQKYVFSAKVAGALLEEQRVPPQPMMPYSGLFVPVGETKCWAEMSTEYENRISHRGLAFAKVIEFFKQQP